MSDHRARWRDLSPAVLVALALFGLYVAAQRGVIASYDGKIMYSVARNLVDHGSLETGGEDIFGFNTPYAVYGVGLSVLMAPAYALERLVGASDPVFATLVNPLLLAVAAAVVVRIGDASGLGRLPAVVSGLVFGALSMAVWASTEVFSEPAVTLGTAVAVLALCRWREGRRWAPWALGAAVGGSMVFRSDSVLLVGTAVLLVPAFVPWARLKRERASWVGVALPIAVAGAWLLAYNAIRYGSPFESRYDGGGFTTPILTGLVGSILSPGKGFFVYNPLLLLALPGLAVVRRRDGALAWSLIALSVVRVLFFARWHSWQGGVAWGPRFLLPLCALLAVPAVWAALTLARERNRLRAVAVAGVVGLGAWSAVLSLASVWVPYEQWVNRVDYVPPEVSDAARPRYLFERARFRTWTVPGSHVVGNLSLLDESAVFPLRHWSGGPTPIGVASAALALGAGALAVKAAGRDQRTTLKPLATSPMGQ